MDNIDQKKVNKELKFGVILSYFLIALNIVSGLLLVPFIIRGIGQSNYGIYTAAASLIAMFCYFKLVQNIQATTLSLTTVMTPMIALLIAIVSSPSVVVFLIFQIFLSVSVPP